MLIAGQLAHDERTGRSGEAISCDVCGLVFVPARSDAKTCSGACRQTAYRRRRGVRARIYNGRDLPGVAAAKARRQA